MTVDVAEAGPECSDGSSTRAVMLGGRAKGWLPDVAVIMWRRMLGALGDPNRVRSPHIHAAIFEYLAELGGVLIKVGCPAFFMAHHLNFWVTRFDVFRTTDPRESGRQRRRRRQSGAGLRPAAGDAPAVVPPRSVAGLALPEGTSLVNRLREGVWVSNQLQPLFKLL